MTSLAQSRLKVVLVCDHQLPGAKAEDRRRLCRN